MPVGPETLTDAPARPPARGAEDTRRVNVEALAALVGARVLSSSVNFAVNRTLVFATPGARSVRAAAVAPPGRSSSWNTSAASI